MTGADPRIGPAASWGIQAVVRPCTPPELGARGWAHRTKELESKNGGRARIHVVGGAADHETRECLLLTSETTRAVVSGGRRFAAGGSREYAADAGAVFECERRTSVTVRAHPRRGQQGCTGAAKHMEERRGRSRAGERSAA